MKTRVDPRIVRRVLEHAAATSPYAAARASGFNHRTVYRWAARRAADPAWPTDDDVARWIRENDERSDERAHKAAQKRAWTTRVYVERGLMMIDATGTTRRLRALYALGWTSTDIAPRLGWSPARVGHLASGRQDQVHRDTAAKIAAVYDDLSMTVPQDPDVLPARTIRVHDRQRRQSAAKGWAPPLAWDDIDDPDERPTFGRRTRKTRDDIDPAVVERVLTGEWRLRTSQAEKVEICRRWRAAGRFDTELERLTGWNVNRIAHPREPRAREESAA